MIKQTKKNWINILLFFSVFIITILLKYKFSSLTGVIGWIGYLFYIGLLISGMYEITIKDGIKNKLSRNRIIIESIIIWLIPLSIGYIITKFLN